MPQLTIKASDKTKIEKIVKEISVNLANVVDISPDRVFITINETMVYKAGEEASDVCIVDIAWLKRSLEMRKEVANSIKNTILNQGFSLVKISFKDNMSEDLYN